MRQSSATVEGRGHKHGFCVHLVCFAVLYCSLPFAAQAEAPSERQVVASFAKSGEQSALALARHGDGLHVARCAGARCEWTSAVEVPLPKELVPGVDADAFERIDIGRRRSVVRLRLLFQERAWEALIVAPIGKAAPSVVFSDWTGIAVDDEGELRGKSIELYPKTDGGSDVVLGNLDSDVSLCGRKTLLDPKVLYADDLKLHRIKLQRLGEGERNAAQELVATEEAEPLGIKVSRARVASSARGSPAALDDADPRTTWAEARGSDGQGEFVVFSAPATVPVSNVYWRYPVRDAAQQQTPDEKPGSVDDPSNAPNADAPAAPRSSLAVPTRLWVATDTSLFRVTLPEGADPYGKTFRVELPQPEATSCVALVLGGADRDVAHTDVTLAEFGARAKLGDADVEGFVQKLDDPAQHPAPLVQTLTAFGKRGVAALRKRFRKLSPAGRARALQVYDALPCALTARAYARAVRGDDSEEDAHALGRLEQCGDVGRSATARELRRSNSTRTKRLAPLLVAIDPKAAVDVLVPLLGTGHRARRRALRQAVAHAAAAPDAKPALVVWFGADRLSAKALIDLSRALGSDLVRFGAQAAPRLSRIARGAPEYRERYLLLEPASHLAPAAPELLEFLKRALHHDDMAPVRARAARVFPTSAALVPDLLRAVEDPHVRVREAAVQNLGEARVEAAHGPLTRRLREDPWPLVRAASVRALTHLEPSREIDQALAVSAEDDASPHVRRPALLALGTRNARTHRELVLERLEDDDEDPYVRAAAAATLGSFCDLEAVTLLTAQAEPLSRLTSDEAKQVVGRAALSALGRIAPPDLDARLRIFDGPEVPIWAKHAAAAAREHPERCVR